MGFAKYLRKSEVFKNGKVYDRFLQNGLHKRHCYVSKRKCDVEYLEVW